MNRMLLFLVSLMALPVLSTPLHAGSEPVIAVETSSTSLIFAVREDKTVYQMYYGPRMAADEFAAVPIRDMRYTAGFSQAYPATGGRFLGEPALHLRYADGTHNTELVYDSHTVSRRQGTVTTAILLKDPLRQVAVRLVFDAYPAEDVIVEHTEILNEGTQPLRMLEYASGALSLRSDSYLLSHVHGSWAQEMKLESEPLGKGVKVLESRRGTQNTQCANPSFVLSLGTEELQENAGEVVAGALAWSGNYRLAFEHDVEGRLNVICGIHPFASAWPLAAGEEFRTPDMIWTYSCTGAGTASRNLHRWARRHGLYSRGAVHPVLLNSWEGAYFNFNTQTLLRMIDDAAAMDLEMFVLDDGWFGNKYPRNNADAGLGDWQVNRRKLPEGIDYIASYAHKKGLKFGIWMEPEMVNPRSELAEKHPEWVVRSPGREIYMERDQWVLDLANPQVQDFVFEAFDGVLKLSPSIDYVKWDCNRPVFSFGSDALEDQDKFYVAYCQGLYKVMARIRARYPDVLIQCCSAGGARVDYGALRYFDEVWTSDNTDALERIRIQYATSLIYPACVMGDHVSIVPNHQNGNVTPLKFRFDVACQGRLGLELQPKNLSESEMALVRRCVASYKDYRDLVFEGDLYRLGTPYGSDYYGQMYVSEDRSRAVLSVYCVRFNAMGGEGHPFRLQGLDPGRRYRVRELNVDRSCWWGDGGVWSGAFLAGGAFNPVLGSLYSSAVFLLEAE